MKQTTIAELFLELGYDYNFMKENESIDVSDKNYYVKSYNQSKNEIEENLITRIVRKSDSKAFTVKIKDEDSFRVSENHKLLISWENSIDKFHYLDVGILNRLKKSFYVLNKNKRLKVASIEKTNDIIPILDIEVESNHNYFSNNIVSHNTLFGSPEVTTSGNALKFYASIRARFSKKEDIKTKDGAIGIKTKVSIKKNKVAPPFKEATYDMYFDGTIDKESLVIEEAINRGFIGGKGTAWLTVDGVKDPFNGQSKVVDYLKQHPEKIKDLREKIFASIREEAAKKREELEESRKEESSEKSSRKERVSPEIVETSEDESTGELDVEE